MDGVINILKPPGMTSNDVVMLLRKLLNTRKIGHGGTLDPAAAGVLPLFIGKATKAIEFFELTDKEYVAEMALGITTDTGDAEGKVLYTKEINVDIAKINRVFKDFVGKIQQVPPMYSAVHYRGKKLYELAREGITVERKPRSVEIYSLDLISFVDNLVTFRVTCSKGTYIRTLCEDIGQKLGCGAYLSCLVRTRTGVFSIFDSYSLEEVRQNIIDNNISKMIMPVDKSLAHLPAMEVCSKGKIDFTKGSIICGNLDNSSESFVRVYCNKAFIGVAKPEGHRRNSMRIIKTFV